MAFDFEALKGRFVSTVDDFSKAATDTIDVAKLKKQIYDLKKENEKDYIQLGKMVYAQKKEDDFTSYEYGPICDEIERRLGEIADLEVKASNVRG